MHKEGGRSLEAKAATYGGIGMMAYGIAKLEIKHGLIEAFGMSLLAKLSALAAATPPGAFIVAGALLYLYGRRISPKNAHGHGGGHH